MVSGQTGVCVCELALTQRNADKHTRVQHRTRLSFYNGDLLYRTRVLYVF
jgi:hypothetical protein